MAGPERERLLHLARAQVARRPGYLQRESTATTITDYEPLLIPSLAQTPHYAYALISAVQTDEHGSSIETRVGNRMARQTILARPTPPRLHLIIAEYAISNAIGGRDVMARQLRHLADLAERDTVTVNVIPRSIRAHAGLLGAFGILEFANEPAIVHIETRAANFLRAATEEVALYRRTVTTLLGVALDERASIDLILSRARDFAGRR